jgi:hypothetical protein
MAEDRIDDIVSPKALKQLDDLDAKLVATQRQLVDNLEAAIKFNAALSGSKSLKDLDTSYQKAAKSMESLNKAFEKERLSQIRLEQAREKAFDKYEKQLKAQESAQLKANAAAEKAASPYNQLAASLAKAEKEALDLGAAFGTNSREFLDAAKNVQVLRQQVDGLEQPLGRFQRNVGNYRSGFSGLGNSINQLTREFPAFTFSVQTGFLALSNNLPIFFDEIQRTNKEIATLRAQGEKVPGLFKQLALSFFSFGTILSIGITLLTVYGKEIGNFISAIFKGKEAVNQFVERQKSLNTIFKDANKDAGEQISTLKILRAAAQDVTLTDQQRIKAVRELQELYPKTYKALSDEIILTGKDTEETNKLTSAIIAQSKARSAKTKLDEIQTKVLDSEFQKEKIRNAQRAELGRVISSKSIGAAGFILTVEQQRNEINRRAQLSIAVEDENIKLLRNQENFFTRFAGLGSLSDAIIGDNPDPKSDKRVNYELELQREILNGQKIYSSQILSDEKRSLEDRLLALDLFTKQSNELANIERKIALSDEDVTAKQKLVIEQKYQNDLSTIRIDSQKQREDIQKQIAEKELKDLEELFKTQLDSAKKADAALLDRLNLTSEQRQLVLTNEADFALLELARQYSKGEIKSEEYAQKRLDIQAKLAQDLVNEEIKNIQVIIDLQKAVGQDTADQEKKLAELKQRLSKETTAKQISDLEKLAETEKQLNDKKVELALSVRDLGIAIVQGNFEQARERLIQEGEQIDIRKAKEIDAVQRSILSEQEKADRIAVINAKAQGQREALERRQRQIDLSRARFEKAANIANIIGSTAAAVAKSLPNIPLSILVGAIGAVQLATAVAAPLLRFEKGGKMKRTGYAEYGHGTELRIDPDGKVSLTKSTPEVGLVKAGTQFISNKDLARLMAKPDPIAYAGGQSIDLKEVIASQEKSRKDIVGAINANKSGYGGISFYSTAKGRSYLSRNL